MEDDREEGPVNRQAVVVVNSVQRLHSRGIGTLPFGNEAQLIELIEKDPDSRPIRIRDSGIRTVNAVPLPFDPLRVNVPSSARARSRMPIMPRELRLWTNFLVIPFPLSF